MTTAPRPLVSLPAARWAGLWPDGEAPVELVLWDLTAPPERVPELAVLPYEDAGAVAPMLRQVQGIRAAQTLTAGYESVLAHLPDGMVLATAAGVHSASTAELAVGLTIAALRGLDDFARAQPQGRWRYEYRPALADRRVLLIGTGGVGGAIAARLVGFEVSLTRVGRTARQDGAGPVCAVADLPRLLPEHDVVILACPLTEQTRGLADARFLAAMPDGALLVNVARGGVVDTAALLAELTRGRLRAALDVTDPEPLPADHPLWRAPGVLISPHVGGNSSAFEPRMKALLRDQLGRFARGEPLRNVVAGWPAAAIRS